MFIAKSSNHSVTKNVEVKGSLTWFDGKGKFVLIDCPGLSDTDQRD